jgi:membrane protein
MGSPAMNWSRLVSETRPGYLIWRVVQRYGEDYVSIRAGMLSYFVFFSLFPLLLLLISLVGFVVDPGEAQRVVFALLQGFPVAVRRFIEANVLSAFTMRGPVTLIGLGTLAWSTLQVFFAMDYALNQIWDSEETRPWYELYLRATSVIGATLVLVAVTLGSELAWQIFGTVIQPLLPKMAADGLLRLATLAVSLAGSFCLFSSIYRWVPAIRLGWHYIWPGALLATGLWKLSQSAFAWYLRTLSRTEVVYGSIGVIITLMLWLYVSGIILLLGAEWNRALADWHAHQAKRRQPASDELES